MKAQWNEFDAVLRVRPGQAVVLPRGSAALEVLDGRVWLTRGHAADDELLVAGDRLLLAADDDAVIEPYDRRAGIAVRLCGAVAPVPGRGKTAAAVAMAFAALLDRLHRSRDARGSQPV